MSTHLPQPHDTGVPPAGPGDYPAPIPFELEPEQEAGQVNYRRLLATVLRNKWWILALAVAATSASMAYVRTLPAEYVAQATVWIEVQGRGAEGPIRSRELLSAGAWLELLRSYVVLDEVVMKERLYLSHGDPALAPAFANVGLDDEFRPGAYRLEVDRATGRYRLVSVEHGLVEQGVVGDSIGRAVGLQWQPSRNELAGRSRIEFTVRVPREAAIRLSSELGARVDRTGNFLRLDLRGPSAARTASVLNTVVDRFVEVASELKGSHLIALVDILEDQLNYAQSNMEAAERALESFRISTITLPSDDAAPVAAGLEMTRNPVFANFFRLRLEQEDVRRDRQAILAAISGGGVQVEALEVVPSVRNSSQLVSAMNELGSARAELRALLFRYTEEHATVREVARRVERLEREIVPGLALSLADQLAARDQGIQAQIGDASREMEQIPPRAIEEARLRRQVAVTEDLYRTLQRRYEETRLASAGTVADVRVLDRARTPQNPVNDSKSRLVLMALFASLGLGVVGAIARDRLDATLRYADQVSDDMGLTVLGAVPQLSRKERSAAKKQMAEAKEAFRSIRMNVMYAYGSAGPVLLAVSSPGPGDGKSFVTANLATAFADLGKRVLVIDGDIRRGGLHRVFSRQRSPGLLDHLSGEATREQVIRSTPFPNIHFIPTGTMKDAGPELVSSPEARSLLTHLRAAYDVILIDTAPLGAGIDPFVLASLTGNLVLVLRTGTTNRDLAEAKLGLVTRLPIRVLGTVINGLSAGDHSHYHRYYSYLPGYESRQEQKRAPTKLVKVST